MAKWPWSRPAKPKPDSSSGRPRPGSTPRRPPLSFDHLEDRVAPAVLPVAAGPPATGPLTASAIAVTDTTTTTTTGNAVTVNATGSPNLVTHIVLPSALGVQSAATLYVEYSNTGTAPLAAPLLTLTATQLNAAGAAVSQALLTLDPSVAAQGPAQASPATGFGPSVQILASGATPGVLRPGESEIVPVYWDGWQQPWNPADPPFRFSLTVTQASDTTAINWASLQSALQPMGISAAAWSVLFGALTARFGSTAGGYVQQLDADAAYFGSLGESVIDVSRLWSLEIGETLGPGSALLPDLAAGVDVSRPAPGMPVVFSRTFANSVLGRTQAGPLGYGWFDNWQTTLTVAADGSATIHGEGGTAQTFLPDGGGGYTAPPGDFDTLTAPAGLGGDYLLTDQSGNVTAFLPGGAIDYVEGPDGNTVTAGYDGSGRLVALTHSSGQWLQISYNGAGLIASVTDSSGGQTTYTYDPTNQCLVAVTGPDGRTVHYTYDTGTGTPTSGALLSVAYPDGTHDLFTYDALGRLSTTAHDGGAEKQTWTYGPGDEVSITDANGNTSNYFFDDRALIKTEDPLGNATTYTLDSRLDLVSVTNALGQVTTNTYGGDGLLTSSTDPAGNTVAYGYTQAGAVPQLSSVTDANGNVTTYGYDPQGNLLSITYPDSAVQQFSYDPLGNQIGAVDANGRATASAYNDNGQVTLEKFADGSSAAFTYDTAGDLLTATTTAADGTTSTTNYSYFTGTHELAKISYPNGLFLKFTYDAGGRRDQSVDQSGFTVNYQYDAVGRLAQLTDGAGGLIVRYIYDPTGRLVEKDLGNGTYTTYQYDAAGNLAKLVNYGPRPAPGQDGPVNSSFAYGYDALGRMITMTTAAGEWAYAYDESGNLARAVFVPSSPTAPGQSIAYLYDAAGNRTAMVVNGVTTYYTSNDRNEYVKVGSTTYTYDADGNLTSATGPGGTTTYTYNAAGQLVGVTAPDGTTTAYAYDALGRPIAVTTGGQTTDTLYDPIGLGYVVGAYTTSGGVVADYTYGLGLTSQVTGSGAAYYDFDATGSTVGLTGASGGYVNQYSYLPYGVVASSAGSLANPFTFQGQSGVYADGSGGLSMGTRDYSPSLGRFTTPDPLGITAGSANLAEYAANDPLNLSQPTGLTVMASGVWDAGASHTAVEVSGQYFAQYAVLASRQGDLFDAPLQAGYWSRGQEAAPPRQAMSVEVPADMGQAMIARALNQQLENDYHLWASTADELRAGAVNVPGNPYAAGYANVVLRTAVIDYEVATLVALGGSTGATASTSDTTLAAGDISIGTAGYGAQNFVAAGSLLAYRVDFVNDDALPAQQVVVTDQLDPSLDWSTFRFTEVGFGNVLLAITPGTQNYQATVPTTWDGEALDVAIQLSFNPTTGLLLAVFEAIDPTTGLPPDLSAGFLPPDGGSGHIGFVVLPRAGLAAGAEIHNTAWVAVGADPAVSTAPNGTDLTTIDSGPPMAGILPLPPVEASPSFTVGWWGQDVTGGSGIAYYDVYYSDNGGTFQPLLRHTTLTSTTFTGTPGHAYSFCCLATDNVGNVQPTPLAAQASTAVRLATSMAVTSSASNGTLSFGMAVTFTATVSMSDPAASLAALAGETVTFSDGTRLLGTGVLNTHGVATFSTAALGAGLHVITASYAGDVADEGSSGVLKTALTVTRATPAFTRLSASQTIAAGTASITLSGALAVPSPTLAGESVTITVRGASTTAMIRPDGSFSAVLPTAGLAAAPAAYAIVYSYAGDANYNAATNATTALTVTARAADATSRVTIRTGAILHVAGSTAASHYNYTQTITITNTSGSAIAGPISLQLTGLANARLYISSGTSRTINAGSAYLLLSNTSLAAGASLTVTLYFYDPTALLPHYVARLIAGGTP